MSQRSNFRTTIYDSMFSLSYLARGVVGPGEVKACEGRLRRGNFQDHLLDSAQDGSRDMEGEEEGQEETEVVAIKQSEGLTEDAH